MVNSTRSFAGCGPIAMAQIMNYYQYPASYNGAVYQWGEYKDQYKPNDDCPVSQLIFDCGKTTKSIYRETETETYNIKVGLALFKDFSYSPNIALWSRGTLTLKKWHDLICSELIKKQPCYISYGESNRVSHICLIDGVDANGFLHFNWGWGGIHNGFYDLSFCTTPSDISDRYFNYIYTLTNIIPRKSEADTISHTPPEYESILADSSACSRLDKFKVSVHGVFNNRPMEQKMVVTLALFNEKEKLLCRLGDISSFYLDAFFFTKRWWFISIPKSLESGRYKIRPVFCNPKGLWEIFNFKFHQKSEYLLLEIKNDSILISPSNV